MAQINSNLEICSLYVGSHSRVHVHCKICGAEFEATPTNLLSGKGCRSCSTLQAAERYRMPHDEFVKRMRKIHPDIMVLSEYVNRKIKVICSCLICGLNWEASPNNLLSGYGCPQCGKERAGLSRRKSNDEFIDEMRSIHPNIQILSPYSDAKSKVECLCLRCGHHFKMTPDHLTNGRCSCPRCKQSRGEERITVWLETHNIPYIPQFRFSELCGVGGGLLSYDFYLPEHNILIEFQGQFHDGTVPFQTNNGLQRQQTHDRLKREFAVAHHIKLLEIWYYEFSHIDEILTTELYNNPVTITA